MPELALPCQNSPHECFYLNWTSMAKQSIKSNQNLTTFGKIFDKNFLDPNAPRFPDNMNSEYLRHDKPKHKANNIP